MTKAIHVRSSTIEDIQHNTWYSTSTKEPTKENLKEGILLEIPTATKEGVFLEIEWEKRIGETFREILTSSTDGTWSNSKYSAGHTPRRWRVKE